MGRGLKNTKWLRNRPLSSRVNGYIPIQLWDPSIVIDFPSLLIFSQPGFAFIYRPQAEQAEKLKPSSEPGHFIGIESDTRLIRVYTPESESVKFIRKAEFTTIRNKKLPINSSLLDFLAWKHEIEVSNGDRMDSRQENIIQFMISEHQQTLNMD